ncbi:hypothetical protein [Ensifer sp. Root142]|uniref:hypothetical protein n=1 Tax=Ensifer sp. Root142 TaxID=1736461 RepID=UPI000AA70689|nr:hypothetical protein [Ensifer sp. Root142]
MSIPYVTGTVSVANGNAVVTGAGTAWATSVLNGGLFGLDGSDGNPIPILSIDSNTQLTLAKPWRGATGEGQGYWIQRDTAYGQQTVANAQALSTYLQRLDNASLSALAAISAQLGAGKVPRGLSATVMEMFTVTDFAKTFLDKTDAAAVRAILAAQAALGFTPVQQGGGSGQGGNKVNIGWDGVQGLTAQVDASQLGKFWMNNDIATGSSSTAVWVRYPAPNFFIHQMATAVINTDPNGFATISMPLSFPQNMYVVIVCNGDANIQAQPALHGSKSPGSFNVVVNRPNGTPHANSAARVEFMAFGR